MTDPVTVSRRYHNASSPSRLALLALLGVGWYFYDRSRDIPWIWSLLYPAGAALLFVIAYVVSHTSFTYSPTFLTKRLAGRVRRLDLTQLVTAGVLVNRRDGQTDAVTGLYLEDREGMRMTLSVVHPYPNAPQWASYVRAALEGSDATVNDRVMSTLDELA
jgi:hypothetical protein